jgi:hypothetical protein
MNCRRCDRQTRHKSLPEVPGLVSYARGLCRACSDAAKSDGTLAQYDRLPASGGRNGSRPRSYTADDFEFYVTQYGGTRASNRLGWTRRTRRNAAARLGMNLPALDRALYRHLEREIA